jgi:hypothetical protein
MTQASHRRLGLHLTLLLVLSLAWPATHIDSAPAQPSDTEMAFQGGMSDCEQCCFRCDDGKLPELPCPGTAVGCSGLLGVTAGIDILPLPATAMHRSESAAFFVSWAPEPDGPPPKYAYSA